MTPLRTLLISLPLSGYLANAQPPGRSDPEPGAHQPGLDLLDEEQSDFDPTFAPGRERDAARDAGPEQANLVEELLDLRSPPPDWRAHVRARLGRGEELPQWEPRSIEPADDAPFDELIAFWSDPPLWRHEEVDDDFRPSPAVTRRFVNAIADEPELAAELLDFPLFSDTGADRGLLDTLESGIREVDAEVMRAYQALVKKVPEDKGSISQFRHWLMMRTAFLRDELIEAAGQAGEGSDDPFGPARPDAIELDRLAEVDWPAAEGILKQFAAGQGIDPHWQVYSLAMLIEQGAEPGQLRSWRQQLEVIALDDRLSISARQWAVELLVEDQEEHGRQPLIDRFRAIDEELIARLVQLDPTEEQLEAAAAAEAEEKLASMLGREPLEIGWVWWALREHKKLSTRALELTGLQGENLALQLAIGRDLPGAVKLLKEGTSAERAMLLACARHTRLPIPLDLVIGCLESEDPLVARAAQQFLESDDSELARAKLLGQRPDQAMITGSWSGFDPGTSTFREYRLRENESRERVLDGEADEVIALLSSGHWGDPGNRIIEIKDGKATLYHREYAIVTGEEDLRYRKRELAAEEVSELRGFIDRYAIADLPAYDNGAYDGIQYEFFQVSKTGGRRVFMNNPPQRNPYFDRRIPEDPPGDIYGILVEKFFDLERARPMAVRYRGIDGIRGFEVLSKREEVEVYAISGEGGELKLLRRVGGPYEGKSAWHRWDRGGLSARPTTPPEDVPRLEQRFGFTAVADGEWQGRSRGVSVLARRRDAEDEGAAAESGLWVHQEGGDPWLLARGDFDRPVFSSDGRWLAATSGEELFLIRFETRESRAVDLPAGDPEVLAYVDAHQQFLIKMRGRDGYRLLDPDSGELAVPMGDFHPLDGLSWRPLQATGNPDEVWATDTGDGRFDLDQGTRVGRYNLATFQFKSAKKIPNLLLDANQIWVDEQADTIYVVERGDLLKFPLSE